MSEDLLSIRVAEVRAGRWELTGSGELSLFNDFLGYVADRGYSPRTVRAYAFDLLHLPAGSLLTGPAWMRPVPMSCCATWPRTAPNAGTGSTRT